MATLPVRELSPLPHGHPCYGCEARKVAVCGVLPPLELAELKDCGSNLQLQEGQPLFHEGDPASQVYNVTQGTLRLYKLLPDGRRQIMGFMMPGDFLGASIGGEHAFTAEALEPTRLCRFGRARFADFGEEHPALERELYRLAGHELAAAQAQMVLLGRKSAVERVASFFMSLLDREERFDGKPHKIIDLPMSRSEIADYLGLTKETVSRVFAELKNRRLIRLAALTRVEVLDRHGLADVAEGYSEA
ncbi:Crp/Fnr family transcriptional regulator [Sphingomonas sp. GCM10030256]|uniref:Crp/Fnr family transcriptional regulator n=1 Tax=Sphingomonas sp. GCM10030256 TaxID=3273427 RepID=UPI00360D3847